MSGEARLPGLSAPDIVRVWETGQMQNPVERALTMLAGGSPGVSREALAGLTLGERDRRLLQLRAGTFGDTMTAFTRCPKCRAESECAIAVSELPGPAQTGGVRKTHVLCAGRTVVRFRLLNSRDQAAAAGLDPDDARRLLAERCVLSARQGKRKVPAGKLPDTIVTELAARLAELDPLAELTLNLRCAQCGNEWPELLDPAGFFWTELAAEATRLLGEVHVLARAYGWREADVFALSPQRRRYYLELVEG